MPLTILRNPQNQGERTTVNNAVQTLGSPTQWFFSLHADDLAKPDWLDVMLRGIDAAPPKTASFTASYDVLYSDGRVTPGETFGESRKVRIEGTAESIRDTIKRGCWFKISSCAIRVSTFRQLGGFMPDMPQLGDLEFVLRVLRDGCAIEYIPLCLSIYRQHAQSVSSRSFQEHRDVKEGLVILDRFRDSLSGTDITARYFSYLYVLARRSGRSLLRRDFDRFKAACALGARIAASLSKNLLS